MQNNQNTLVSIVMATFNGEKFIVEQIDSVLSQSYRAIELIICDDGSSDKTVEIVKSYVKKHKCIALHQNSKNLGFVKNFEKGIGLSSAKYIALCDQDDIWESNKLEVLMDEMVKQECITATTPVMIHSDLCVVDAQNRMQYDSYFKLKKYTLKEIKDLGHIAGPCGVMGNTILFNQALKEKILPFPDCVAFHDQWIALVNEVIGIRVTLNRPLLRYRVHEGNSSNSQQKITHYFPQLLASFCKGEIRPPYLDSARICMIENILDRYIVEGDDKGVLSQFLVYLKQKKGSWKVLSALWHHDLIKRDLLYRLGFSANYLLFKEKQDTVYLFGFSYWKHTFIQSFFTYEGKIVFCHTLEEALNKGMQKDSKIYIWGKKPFEDIEVFMQKHHGHIYRVEDGFIRSVSLGSDLTKAYSLVIDSRGIYFDPQEESDLEYMLNTHTFDAKIIHRAQKLQAYLRKHRISKYNTDQEKYVELEGLKNGQRVILVPGQVEDDASILYGADGMSNLELLIQTRKNSSEAYIIFKPHPDVLAGNRKGNVHQDTAKKFADIIVEDVSLDSVLDLVDEVHTMTSLVGFEALIREKKVTTYGLPFYAGWGLTTDMKRVTRRTKKRTLDELVAAALILYPKYIDPESDEQCEIEVLLEQIDKEKKRYNKNSLYKIYKDARNIILRKIQRLIKGMKGE